MSATATSTKDRSNRAPAVRPVLAVAGAAALVGAVITRLWLVGAPAPEPLHGVSMVSLAMAFALAEIVPVHFEHRREAVSISLTTVPLVVGVLAAPAVTLIVARLLGSAAVLVVHRRQQPTKLAVNLSSFWIQTAVTAALLHALAGTVRGPGSWPSLVVAVLVGDAAQTIVLTVAISVYQRRWEPSLLQSAAVSSVAAVVETSVGLVAVALLRSQPAALLPLAVVTTMVLLSYRTHRSLGDRHRELTELYDFTRVMGDALLEDRVVDSLLEHTRELIRAERAWLYLEGRDSLLTRVDGDAEVVAALDPAGAGAALHREVCAAGSPVHITAADEPRRSLLAGLGARELLAAPLVGPSGSIGTLVAADRGGVAKGFGPDEVRLFATVANSACVSLENQRLVDRLRSKAAENEHQALHDSLTGLPNRVLFGQMLDAAIAESSPAAVLLLDLDRFKEVNDTLGHHNGDALLREVGSRLRRTLRRGDVIARLGGDEFAVLLPDINGEQAAVQVARGMVELLEQPFEIGDMSVSVGASIGIAVAPRHGTDGATLLQRADVAMYTAKADQSDVELYETARDGYSPERLALVGELRRAVQQRHLVVHYQPQVDLATGEPCGVEALVRWNHPVRGLVPPDEFVPMAERTGLIRPLTLLVLDESLRDWRTWAERGWHLRLSVNISARSLLDPALPSDVAALLERHGVPADRLCLEVTESSIMGDPRRTGATLDALRSLGVTISVDDFGTGQTSLAYLKRLPVGEVKVDKSFVLSMLTDRSDEAIVRAVVDLARTLGIPVVAEGVEDDATRERLQAMGCAAAQGWLFGRPVPTGELSSCLETTRPSSSGEGGVVVPFGRSSTAVAHHFAAH